MVKGQQITPSSDIKILGIKFDEHMTWNTHFKQLKKKAILIINKLRYLEKFMDREQMKRIVTSHFFGSIYYASPVWLNEISTSVHWRILNSIHYRALRTAVKDHWRLLPKKELNNIFQRATPSQWMKYSCCKLAIRLYNLGDSGPPMSTLLKNSAYINDRQPERAYFRDSSRIKIGRHSFVNRLNAIRDVKFGWTQGINPNKLRIELKKTFINLWIECSSYYFIAIHWAYFLLLFILSALFVYLVPGALTRPWDIPLLKRCYSANLFRVTRWRA